MDEALIVARFLHDTSLMAVFGGNAFRIYAFADGAVRSGNEVVVEFDGWTRRLSAVGGLIALLSAVALLCLTTAGMVGRAAAAVDKDSVASVLFDTSFGRVWQWRLLLAAALAATSLVEGGTRARWVVLLLAGLLLASLALVGHAAMGEGAAGLGHELNDALHLLAAGLWVGALWPLLRLLRKAATARDPASQALTHGILQRFSRMGYFAVGAVAATGAVNTLLLVGHPSALLTTPYGCLLSAKILLFLLMVEAALTNRFRLGPRLAAESSGSPWRPLRCSVVIEQALGIAIIAAISVLGTWPPAIFATAM